MNILLKRIYRFTISAQAKNLRDQLIELETLKLAVEPDHHVHACLVMMDRVSKS